MTMIAKNATGFRNLFKLSSLASIERQLDKRPRIDDELVTAHAEGIIAARGCPSGEIQTRLRLGNDRGALEAATKWQVTSAATQSLRRSQRQLHLIRDLIELGT